MTDTSTIRWRSFALHKEGNSPEEYEDAFAGDPKTGRFAVADGAAESSFARYWARLLVESFVASRERKTSTGWQLPALQQRWAKEVDKLQLDWFGEEKRTLGAFATFLGLSVKKPQGDGDGRWMALAVGDSCLFHVRSEQLVAAFPVKTSPEFDNRPALLASRSPESKDDQLSRAKRATGRWQAGDHFFLMTDAAAQWFLRRQEEQRRPWHSLLRRLAEPKANAVLATYIEDLRKQNAMKNDDVTLLVIDL